MKNRLGCFVACLCCAAAVHADAPFVAAPSFYTGLEPWGVVIADFNNDGHPDVAIANFDTPGYANVLAGNGQGGFAYRSTPHVNRSSQDIAAGDFNGDGKLDLVVSSISNDETGDIVSVLKGRGDATFDAAVEYAVGRFPTSVAVADMDGDGKLDIVTANSNSNSFSVLAGKGDGTFFAKVDHDIGANPMTLAIRDMDGDGIPDVVVATNSWFASFAVLYGNGGGTFGSPMYAGQGGALYFGSAIADINNDGLLDVVLLDRPGAQMDVFRSLGQKVFANVVHVPTDASVQTVAAESFFGDGRVQLISAGENGARMFDVLGDGTVRDIGLLPGIVGGAHVAIGDINHDGRPDVVAPAVTESYSTALLNDALLRSGFDR